MLPQTRQTGLVRQLRTVSTVVALLVAAACSSDSPTGPGNQVQVSEVEILNRSTNAAVAHTHGSGSGMHWHGKIHLHPGDDVAYTVRFLDAGGQAISLSGEYSVHAQLAPGSSGSVITLSPHGDHVDIEAIGEGEVDVIFSLRRGSTAVFEAPALTVEVVDHDHGEEPNPSEIASIRLDYRDGSGHIVHTHGSGSAMHWHGNLHLHPGDEVEIDVTFRNADGDTLRFFDGDEYTLGAALAPGSDPATISVEVHGDHLKITAEEEGTVELIVSVLHGDHSDFDSPPLEVEVEDHGHGSPDISGIVSIALFNRNGGEELAHTHGSGDGMHWHGKLHLHPGDEVELDVVFRDEDGEEIDFFGAGGRTLGAALAEGAAEGILSLEVHGDHVEISALAEGVVDLIFSILHDEEVEFAAPVVEVEVEDH